MLTVSCKLPLQLLIKSVSLELEGLLLPSVLPRGLIAHLDNLLPERG